VSLGFALENQTRPIYSSGFFYSVSSGWSVIVHELAHQWVGDSLTVSAWQHIWLNEGFASYTEWLWAEHEGLGTADETFESWNYSDASDPFWSVVIGDPGPELIFDYAVYQRGALTLHALRRQVGDEAFFAILKEWTTSRAGESVGTSEFIALAERLSQQDLSALFEAWLFTPAKPTQWF
jgi:aminopeptidase N